ncbi:MAG: hypothetical protein K9L71_03140 [Candidatus Omnitrophica bacterium]|nr:hypothetical protein [Candidatus Omnitrophota bacterium]
MKNKIFFWEILLYFLVITTLYLFSFILSSLYIFLGMIAVTAGFAISFFAQNNKKISKIVNFGIGAFTLAVCFWMVWSILGSSFVFEDLILIFSEGIFYLIIILSFNYKYKRYSSYLQFLSLAIFLSIPLFIETDNLGYIILALFYLFLWIVLTKASLRGQRAKTIFSSGMILASGAVFFILVVALAAVLAKQGLIPKLDADRGYIETVKFSVSADRLRVLEEKMYKKGLDAKIKPLKEKQRFLSSLSALLFPEKINAADMEDSLSKINKILAKAKKDAETKEEEKEIDELVSIFEEYPEVKRKVENRNSRNSFIKKTIKNRSVSLKDKINSFIEVNKFSKSKNMKEFRQKARELKKGVPDFKSREAKELQEIFRDVKEWQAYSIYKDIGQRVEKFLEAQETAGQESMPFGQQKTRVKESLNQLEEEVDKGVLELLDSLDKNLAKEPGKDQLYQKANQLEQTLKEMTESVKNDIEKAQSQSGLKKVSRRVREEGEKLKSAAKQMENAVDKKIIDKELNKKLQGRAKKLGQVLKDGLNKLEETLRSKTQEAKDISGLADAFEKIKETSEISRLNEIHKKINEIQKKANRNQQAWKDIKEIAESKTELLFAKASEELSGSEESSHLSELAKDYLQTIVSSQDYDNVLEAAGKLSEIVKNYRDLAKKIHNSQGYKTGKERLETVKQNKKINIGQQLREEGSFSQDKLKQLTESLENSGTNSQEIKESLKKLEEEVKKMPKQGLLSQNSEEKVLSELEDFSKAAQAKSILENMFKEQEAQKYEDAIDQLSKMLEKLDIQDEEKEQKLQEMKSRLAQSNSLAEIEMIKKEMQELVKPSENQRHLKRQAEKVKESIEEISRQREKVLRSDKLISLMENLNTVKKNIKEKEIEEKIEQIMKKLEKNYLNNENLSQELKKELEELAENISNNFYNTEEKFQKAGLPGWDFIVFPKQMVVAEDSRKQLSSLGVYRGKFLKDITSDVHWKVEDSSVAWINEQGLLYGISKGRTQGYAVYNEDKKTIDIIVAEPLER